MTTRPDHLFLSDDGTLYDTRDMNWSTKPLREGYLGTGNRIETVAEFKAALRHGQTTDLGGYPLYFVVSDGAAISFEAARENFRQIVDSIANVHNDGWRVVGQEINYEEEDLFCAHTGKRIASAYGNEEELAEAPSP
ncbi:hypothetical protein G6L37_01875 [Agrobacterium rubi]|nr:hypothetical protein [Agrobacterium rubi]NTF24141.1 hypothetical protein [Agrobacterium rubi]